MTDQTRHDGRDGRSDHATPGKLETCAFRGDPVGDSDLIRSAVPI